MCRAEHPHAERPRELLGLALWLRVERDPAEAAIGDGDEELADRRVGDVVRHVEQPFCSGGVTETAVESGGDGHPSLLLSRRTPDEAAWRAASSLEFSASAIWS